MYQECKTKNYYSEQQNYFIKQKLSLKQKNRVNLIVE